VIPTLPPIPETFALGVRDYPEHVPWEQCRLYPERHHGQGITHTLRIAGDF
jgi:hypothetical protein